MVATETEAHTVSKWVVRILLECFNIYREVNDQYIAHIADSKGNTLFNAHLMLCRNGN